MDRASPTADCRGRSLTRACDRRAIRLAYGSNSGTFDLCFFGVEQFEF